MRFVEDVVGGDEGRVRGEVESGIGDGLGGLTSSLRKAAQQSGRRVLSRPSLVSQHFETWEETHCSPLPFRLAPQAQAAARDLSTDDTRQKPPLHELHRTMYQARQRCSGACMDRSSTTPSYTSAPAASEVEGALVIVDVR